MDFEITEVSGPHEVAPHEDCMRFIIRYRTSDGESNWMGTSSIEPRTPEEIVQAMLERNAEIDAYREYLRRPDVPIPPWFPSLKRYWARQTDMRDWTEEEAKESYIKKCERLGYILDENMVPHKPSPT